MLLGVHISKTSKVTNNTYSSLHEAIKSDTDALNLTCAQIFTHGPRNSLKNKYSTENIRKLGKNIRLSVHSTYVIQHKIWKINTEELLDRKSKKHKYYKDVLNELIEQIKACNSISNGAYTVDLVLHLPRSDSDISSICKLLSHWLAKYRVRLLLENIPCTDKSREYSSPSRINMLCNKLKNVDNNTWGLCIDTSHVWSSGYNLSSRQAQDTWFSELTPYARDRIKMFHLNGSQTTTFNTNRDVHIIAMAGNDDLYPHDSKISDLGVGSIIRFAKEKNIPIICEINRGTPADSAKSIGSILEYYNSI